MRSENHTPLKTRAMGLYIWNWMMAMCNGFSVCSDFIVVVMTTVRYAKYRINCECEAYFGRT